MILDIIPYVVVTSLETDAFMAIGERETNEFEKKKVLKDQLLF